MTGFVTRRDTLAACTVLLAGCTTASDGTGQATTAQNNPAIGVIAQMGDLELTSPAFDDGEPIPDKYGKAYENVNPPLEISGVPGDAETLALVMDDPDAPGGTFDHWLAWNIPAGIGAISEGWEPPADVVQGKNDFGNRGYGGPKPPSKHTYRFKLYALDTDLDLPQSADKQRLGTAMDGHVLAQTQLTGTFAP